MYVIKCWTICTTQVKSGLCENKYIRPANINSSVTLIEMFESVVEYSFNCLEAEDKTKGYQISLFIKEALCIAGPEHRSTQEQTDMKIRAKKMNCEYYYLFQCYARSLFFMIKLHIPKNKANIFSLGPCLCPGLQMLQFLFYSA